MRVVGWFLRWFFGSIWRVITGVVIALIVYVIVDSVVYGGEVITAIGTNN